MLGISNNYIYLYKTVARLTIATKRNLKPR
jgi:hypothetical protein